MSQGGAVMGNFAGIYDEMEQRIVELEAQLAEVRKDAARYYFWKARYIGFDAEWGDHKSVVVVFDGDGIDSFSAKPWRRMVERTNRDTTMLNDIARCNGRGHEQCETCVRRTAPRPKYYWITEGEDMPCGLYSDSRMRLVSVCNLENQK
jgi:hypothetical protein